MRAPVLITAGLVLAGPAGGPAWAQSGVVTIYNAAVLKSPPTTFRDLPAPRFKNKIQYSTPGQAGDGTAVMLNAFQAFGGPTQGFAYLKSLQVNNLGPSSSTGRLTALVNKGEIWVANGHMQMNLAQMRDNPNVRIFWPAGPDGKRLTFSLPYDIALVHGAPHAENGRKLIDFLLSKEAQSQVASIATGIPVREDVQPSGETYATMQDLLKGVEIWSPDWASLLKNLEPYVSESHQQTGG